MRTRISLRAVRSPLLAIALVAAFAGTVVATGATGFSATLLARGTLSTDVQFNTGAVKLQTKGDVDFVHSMVTIQPNGSSGAHTDQAKQRGSLRAGARACSRSMAPRRLNPGKPSAPNMGRTGAPLSVDQGRCRWIAISFRRLAAGIGRRTPT